MSRIVASAAIRGTQKIVKEAEDFVNKAITEKGEKQKVEFPETAFYLPMAYALMGVEVKTVGEMKPVLEEAKSLLSEDPSERVWLPYLGDALDAGVATLLGEELIVALRYLYGQEPQPDCNGFFTDTILRQLGIQLVDGRMPGFAAILGAAPDNKTAVEIVRELQKRSILSFVGSSVNGRSIIDQLKEEKVEMGWDTYIVPYGRDTITAIYPLNWAIRGALTFGGHKRGEALKCLKYCQNRIFAFGLALGEVDELKYATGAGAINMGFPVIADTEIPEIRPTGICTYEHLVRELDHKKIVSTSIEVRGVKVKISEIPIPVSYAAAFEGERVRREDMYVEFGGKYSTAFEYLRMKELDEIEDGKIEVIGPEIDEAKEGGAMPLGILVEVAGRKMQKDFESILERQIHTFLNEAMGIFHMGQRNMCWLRISKEAQKKGFKIKHFGVILHARLQDTFGAIVDKAQVSIYTKQEDVERIMPEAEASYKWRDERMAGMVDESVDTYYSCTLCQSYAPDHVCIISPERLGLCGAYNWLDGKAAYEINPTGPNQPILKGKTVDPVKGQWEGVNEVVYAKSNKHIERFNAYSLMEDPETSCVIGDVEVIIEGKPVKIGDFVDEHRGGEEYANFSALTLSEGKAKQEKMVALQRFELNSGKKLVRIKTKSGNEILLTPNHQIAVDRPEGITWVPSSQLSEKDRVISLKKLDVKEEIPDLFDIIPGDFYVSNEILIKRLKKQLALKYGSLGKALEKLSLKYFRNNSISLACLKLIVRDLNEDWDTIKKSIKKVSAGWSEIEISDQLFSSSLFYIVGLIASDGSVSRVGRYEYKINFINTNENLISRFCSLYRKVFPGRNIDVRVKGKSNSLIGGRKIKPARDCFDCYANNPLFGVLLEHFGIKVGLRGKWNLTNMINLPREFIVSFITGIFDGDGSVRLRKYKDKWDIGEAYLCIEDKAAAHHLQLMLKRLGIVGNVRGSGSVHKIELHGDNLYEFSRVIRPSHEIKRKKLKEIEQLWSEKEEINKTQNQVLPLIVGRTLAKIPESKAVLSPSTHFHYKTGRSRPVLENVERVLKASNSKEANFLKSMISSDFYLDIVARVEGIKTNEKFVYNLTTSDTHCYFANQVLIKNCGCFECIVAIIPEANGVMVVNREYPGMTPCGMAFSTLAGSVGGGNQTPGFLGVGRLYMVSKKFISAEGGLKRVVWMPKELKEALGDRLKARAEEIGSPDLIDKIADESVAETSEQLLSFLEKVKHPALTMEPLM